MLSAVAIGGQEPFRISGASVLDLRVFARAPGTDMGTGSRPSRQSAQHRRTADCKAVKTLRPPAAAPSTPKHQAQHAQHNVFWTQQGTRVAAAVTKEGDSFAVAVKVDVVGRAAGDASICWGLYRTSAAKWQVPKDLVAADAKSDHTTGGLKSPLHGSKGAGNLTWTLKVPGRLAPVYLAFKLRVGEAYMESRHGPHFAVPIGMGIGDCTKLGPTLTSIDAATYSVNFALRSRHASAISLCLARQTSASDGASGAQAERAGKGYLELALDPEINRTGDVWHVCLHGLRDIGSLCYAWRADSQLGSDFVPGQVMLDPQAPLAMHVALPQGTHLASHTGKAAGRPGDSPALMGSLAALLHAFDFGREHRRPQVPLQRAVLLEVDVPSFSSGPQAGQGVPPEHQGKYLGILDRLAHIRAVGATAVVLSPPLLSGAGDGPFGRAPFSFFAPELAWASGADATAPARELQEVVKGLHAQGIEVWLQVEFCFTAEGNEDEGCTVSLRGLDAPIYYRQRGVLNCGHAVVRCLILDALRHWTREFRVDGFVFVNAETLGLDRHGNILDNPPLAESIATDPLLADVRLVAWPGDTSLLPRGGVRGFPHWGRWLERNLRCTADLAQALGPVAPPSGLPADPDATSVASALATRMVGSADLFEAAWERGLPGALATPRLPACGLNAASVLSQGTLQETVERLLPAGEGAASDDLQRLRTTLGKTLLMAVLLMQGTPLLTQDAVEGPAAARFAGVLVRVRRRLAHLLAPPDIEPANTITWHGATAGSQPDWDGSALASGVPGAAFLGLSVQHKDGRTAYLAPNGHEHAIQAGVLPAPAGSQWRRLVDTAWDAPQDALLEQAGAEIESQTDYWVSGKAGILLIAIKPPSTAASSDSAASTISGPC